MLLGRFTVQGPLLSSTIISGHRLGGEICPDCNHTMVDQSIKTGLKGILLIYAQCEWVDNTFVRIFGPGWTGYFTAKRLRLYSTNAGDCFSCFFCQKFMEIASGY